MSSDPIRVQPLEYGSEAEDPILGVIRAMAMVLLILGIFGVVLELMELWQFNLSWRVNGPLGLTIILSLPVTALQIAAGAMNRIRADHILILWIWAWSSIGMVVVSDSVYFSAYFLRSNTWAGIFSGNFMFQLAYYGLQIPLGCGLAVFLMIVLRRMRRVAGPVDR
jgi:hypothetical protein